MYACSKTSWYQEDENPGGMKTPILYRRMGCESGEIQDARFAKVPGNAQVRPPGATPLIESP
jgi:hypothetical protein